MTHKYIHWALLLAVFSVSGCTAYRPAVIPGTSTPAVENNGPTRFVELGDQVRITVLSGESFTGKVLSISNDVIVIVKGGNYGSEETELLLNVIDTIEVEGVAEAGQAAGGVIAITVAVLASLALLISTTGGFGGN